jgi:limonene-1,2-epoxide hydrolase
MGPPVTEQPSTDADNTLVVERALAALNAKRFDELETLLADDVVYVNVGLPATRSRRTTMMVMKLTKHVALEVKVHRTAAEGTTVLNERTDAIIIGPFRLQFWVCGVFEVEDGQITLWRDYFDFYDFVRNAVKGVVGIVLPAVRPAMP